MKNIEANRILLLLLLGCSMISCNDEDFTTGAQFFNDVSFELATWDSLTMKFSTVKFDSSITSSPEGLVVGRTSNTYFGKVNAAAYLQLTPDSSAYQLDEKEVRYDSITLVLEYNNYFLNDTTKSFTLIVDELYEEIELNSETGNLYNTSRFYTQRDIYGDTAMLGQKTVSPRPYTGSSIEIRLSDTLGLKLFEETFDSDNLYSYPADFLDFFKGIKISATEDAEAVIGFAVSPVVKIYYTDNSSIPSEQKYLALTNQSSGEVYFNSFEADYTGTALENITSEDEGLASSLTGATAYMQSGAGLAIRIELPYLKKIIEDNPDLLLNNAEIQLRPIRDQYASEQLLPQTLTMYYVNNKNTNISSTSYSLELTLDDEYDLDTYYSADITEFVTYQLSLTENNENALLITSTESGFSSSLDYVVLGNQQNEDYKAQINLNLIRLKND
ncbi:hypothetical protein [Fulvivirga kasyanovii]